MKDTPQFAIVLPKLPDDRLVLQRRSKDAPYGADQLGTFGGWVEGGETPDEAMKRELGEETSLDVEAINLKLKVDYVISKGDDFPKDRHFFLYTAEVKDLDFEVYEGQGAEAFTVAQIKKRDDLVGATEYLFKNIY